MKSLPILIPERQNWSCHSCAGCCSEHLIEVTPEERQRIVDQKWTVEDGVDVPPVIEFGKISSSRRYRLAHQPDGRCVFLDDRGLCRIHAKFGEPAKPLACQIYPYALHPHGKSVVVSLRFSCPSVIANRGKAVSEQRADLKRIAAAIVPAHAEQIPPPAIAGNRRVSWPDFELLIERLSGLLTDRHSELVLRILRSLAWAHLLAPADFSGLNRTQIREFVDLMTAAVLGQFSERPAQMDSPGRLGRLYFRLIAAQYARKDTVKSLSGGWTARWSLATALLKFTRGAGKIPVLQSGFEPVSFDRLEHPFGTLPDGTEELITRYWDVKIRGLHFCGPAFYGFSLVEGLQSLMLTFPLTLWFARWLAVSQDRNVLQLEDVQRALAVVDHHHGYADFQARRNYRAMSRYLGESGELSRLCAWYAQ